MIGEDKADFSAASTASHRLARRRVYAPHCHTRSVLRERKPSLIRLFFERKLFDLPQYTVHWLWCLDSCRAPLHSVPNHANANCPECFCWSAVATHPSTDTSPAKIHMPWSQGIDLKAVQVRAACDCFLAQDRICTPKLEVINVICTCHAAQPS